MRKKVFLSLFLIFFFFIVGSAISILSITDTTEALKYTIKLHQVEQLRRALIISVQNVQANLYTVHTPLSQDLNLIVDNVVILEDTAKKCTSCHHTRKLYSRIKKVQSLIKDYENLLSYYITARANAERVESLQVKAVAIGNAILSVVSNMSHDASKHLEELTKQSAENIDKVKKTIFITIGTTIIMGIIVAFNLITTITRPIKKLLEATNMIASGKLGTIVSYKDKTEFGELAHRFNIMSGELKKDSEKLQKKQEEVEEKSEELHRRVEELEEFYDMSVGRELRMKELKDKIEKLESRIKELGDQRSK
jgi:nitrate/nitrite-specific signal transduction histidine kinase